MSLQPSSSPCAADSNSPQTSSLEGGLALECVICWKAASELVDFPALCGHQFCSKCIEQWCAKESTCPLCRTQTCSEKPLPEKEQSAAETLQNAYNRRYALYREREEADRSMAAPQRTTAAHPPSRSSFGRFKNRLQRRLDDVAEGLINITRALEVCEQVRVEQGGGTNESAHQSHQQ